MENKDPNQTSIIVDGGLRPESFELDSSRLVVASETRFDFRNALAMPSKGFLADISLWLSVSALAFRIPIQLYFSGRTTEPVALIIVYALILIFFILKASSMKLSVDFAYRLTLIFLGYAVATKVGYYIN